ncbi:cytidylyltransferase domain-containing protein [Prochlorococcus sp. MIT 1306]|uniref:acylneuraminate cytidylyltransferase family protein n=1 Tax=Prochlorococcus sp. MIT 1306 TaxID=1799667 RepID=UPI0007B3F5C4|nr:acylneuraminate cytidylyltransferase family protein [Prochlorococcus sp. MIT 1306]KZR61087.1 CMP-N,N'-diacetyllegionaminic acid synthase [Prochlorococcus sp. MIT 1306]
MPGKVNAFIFARGGSKGLPRKNILPIAGHPLVAHSIKIAQQISCIKDIFVSTDCSEIGTIAQSYGAKVIWRPEELADDDAPEWLAWQHAIKNVYENYGEFDIFVSLPPTSPCRIVDDVLDCIKELENCNDMVFAITESKRNPWFNMVKYEGSKVKLINSSQSITRRQDAPKCFDITTVAYAAKCSYIVQSNSIWDGSVGVTQVPEERAIDIDSEFDFKIAKFLIESRSFDNLLTL